MGVSQVNVKKINCGFHQKDSVQARMIKFLIIDAHGSSGAAGLGEKGLQNEMKLRNLPLASLIVKTE